MQQKQIPSRTALLGTSPTINKTKSDKILKSEKENIQMYK